MTLAALTGFIGLLAITSRGGPVLACGREVTNEQLVLVPVGETADIVGPDLFGSESLAVDVLPIDNLPSSTSAQQPSVVNRQPTGYHTDPSTPPILNCGFSSNGGPALASRVRGIRSAKRGGITAPLILSQDRPAYTSNRAARRVS